MFNNRHNAVVKCARYWTGHAVSDEGGGKASLIVEVKFPDGYWRHPTNPRNWKWEISLLMSCCQRIRPLLQVFYTISVANV